VFYLQWAILGGFVAEYPSAASDFLGRAAVAVKGGDGRLYLRRESGAIGSFGPWTPIATQCSNGIDDDGDGHADFPDDPGCRHASAPLEAPECDDGLDNDGDGRIDLGDRQCFARADRSERVDCANGIDDDGDGSVDSADVGCLHSGWPFEDPECSDDVDNDLDTQLDWDGAGLGTGDAACVAPFGVSEVPEPGAGSIASLVAGLALVGRLRSRGRWPAARAGRADT